MERAAVYLIPDNTRKALRVGRYLGYEYKENHIKFQDHSVGIESGQISFGRRLDKKAAANGEGFNGCSYRFKCSDVNGVLYAHTGQGDEEKRRQMRKCVTLPHKFPQIRKETRRISSSAWD